MISIKRFTSARFTLLCTTAVLISLAVLIQPALAKDLPYPIVDTNRPSYRDNGDGTISDLITGLMWTREMRKLTYQDAVIWAGECNTGGYSDWRLPSIKEMYSLIQFDGVDPDPNAVKTDNLKPFIEASVFNFEYGDPDRGERIIDSQFATTAISVSPVMNGQRGVFGVNFADGRIKCYPVENPRGAKLFSVMYVRGNPEYGKNEFRDNDDGTVTDLATGLMWMQADSVEGMDWPDALAYAENLELAGYDDWRLPNAKELQSIVDYSRSPEATDSAAIDPVFEATTIENEGGNKDFGCYWTSTTHLKSRGVQNSAVYIAFGRSLGWMRDRRTGQMRLMDVHGAGSQRSDPKTGDASDFPYGHGPQGDVIRIENLVRCVRGGQVELLDEGPEIDQSQQSALRMQDIPANDGLAINPKLKH